MPQIMQSDIFESGLAAHPLPDVVNIAYRLTADHRTGEHIHKTGLGRGEPGEQLERRRPQLHDLRTGLAVGEPQALPLEIDLAPSERQRLAAPHAAQRQ